MPAEPVQGGELGRQARDGESGKAAERDQGRGGDSQGAGPAGHREAGGFSFFTHPMVRQPGHPREESRRARRGGG